MLRFDGWAKQLVLVERTDDGLIKRDHATGRVLGLEASYCRTMARDLLETIRQGYLGGPGDESSPLMDVLDPEVEWQTNWPGLAPAVHGPEGVAEWGLAYAEPWEEVLVEVHEVGWITQSTVFVHFHLRARGRDGIQVEMEVFDVLTLRAGRIVLRRTWTDRAPALEAARAGALE